MFQLCLGEAAVCCNIWFFFQVFIIFNRNTASFVTVMSVSGRYDGWEGSSILISSCLPISTSVDIIMSAQPLRLFYYTPDINFHPFCLVRLSASQFETCQAVSSTILVLSRSYWYIISSNLRKFAACEIFLNVPTFDFLPILLLHILCHVKGFSGFHNM